MNLPASVAGTASQDAGQSVFSPDGGPELSVIAPAFNERDNIPRLVALLDAALQGIHWELVVVDDNSPDGTAEVARELAQKDRRVRCIQRHGRRGLSSACVEGILATSSPYVAVIDADLQHDERILPKMLDALKSENLDIVVGSRYVDGGGVGEWSSDRAAASRFATKLAKTILKADLRDPMSGYFMLRRNVFHGALPDLSTIGFKILLDIFASTSRPLRFKEIGFQFRERQFGQSKLDAMVLWEYLMLLLDKTIGHIVPVRFLSFAFVGSTGLVVHMAILGALFGPAGASFIVAHTAATLTAITTNFILNNILTYHDKRLSGWRAIKGWFIFNLVCGAGAAANVGVAGWLFQQNTFWILSSLGGIAVGIVWNYAVSSVYAWNVK